MGRGFSTAPSCLSPPHLHRRTRTQVTPRGQSPSNGPAFILAHRTKPKRRKPYYLNKIGSLRSPPGSSPRHPAVRSTAAGRGPRDTSPLQRQWRVWKWLLQALACPPRGPRRPLGLKNGGQPRTAEACLGVASAGTSALTGRSGFATSGSSTLATSRHQSELQGLPRRPPLGPLHRSHRWQATPRPAAPAPSGVRGGSCALSGAGGRGPARLLPADDVQCLL